MDVPKTVHMGSKTEHVTTTARRTRRCAPAWALLGCALALLSTALVVAPTTAAAAPPTDCTKTIGGTLRGEDERFVSAMIGIDFYDSRGNKLTPHPCSNPEGASIGGYSGRARLNPSSSCCYALDHNGSTSTQYSDAWSVPAPGNAASAWLEIYPKTKNGSVTSYERYGGAMRRYVPVSPSIDVRLPLGCGLGTGGDNGRIEGRIIRNGAPVRVSRVAAWSRAADGTSPIMGFTVQGQESRSDGSFQVEQLSPGQGYALIFTTSAGSFWYQNTWGSGMPVEACSTTPAVIDVTPSRPVRVPGDGPDSLGVVRGDTLHLSNRPAGTSSTADVTVEVDLAGATLVHGDWNGDGRETPGFRRGNVFELSNKVDGSGPYTSVGYGIPSDTPVVGDWNGNGQDTIGVRRGHKFYLRNTLNSGPAHITLAYGIPSDTPVVGDWNGNGQDTFGVRRGHKFYLRNVLRSGPAHITLAYGIPSDTPVVGDWNGNGQDTFGVRRGSQYYLRNTLRSGPADVTTAFGWESDIPIVGNWDGL